MGQFERAGPLGEAKASRALAKAIGATYCHPPSYVDLPITYRPPKRPRPTLRKRKPWEADLTLCIAAICRQTDDGERRLVVSFDKRVETDIAGADVEFKMGRLSKNWCFLMAGDIALARELATSYGALFENGESFQLSELLSSLRAPINSLREDLADRLVRARLGMSLNEFKKQGQTILPDDVFRQVWYDITAQTMDIELILFGWHIDRFRMFKLSHGELVRCEPFAAIGTGAFIAIPALYQREYTEFWKVPEALYAVYEAQRLGSIAPGVSRGPDASYIAVFHFDANRNGLELSLPEPETKQWLAEQFAKLGPQEIPGNLELPGAAPLYELESLYEKNAEAPPLAKQAAT